MDIKGKYNVRSPAVKRLMREAMELHEPTDQYFAQPVEDNLFEWHFTVRGAPDTDFANGRFHGRIILPPEYPMKPPSIILLTPNGRFEVGKKICLSMSAHHPETWQPSWSIRTVLLAIIGFMPSKGEGAIGALEYTSEERRKLAKRSISWICLTCGSDNSTSLLEGGGKANPDATAESIKIAGQINFKSATEESSGNKVNEEAHAMKRDTISSERDSIVPSNASDSYNPSPKDDIECEGEIRGNADDSVYSTPETVGTETVGNTDSSSVGTNDVSEAIGSRGTDGVRRRMHTGAREEDDTESLVPKKESNGLFSLVLLWIVVISLVILIFRRLCMDAMSIGQGK